MNLLTNIINDIYKNPFVRNNILQNQSFNKEINLIDVTIRLQKFISVITKIFYIYSTHMFGSPTKRCVIKVNKNDFDEINAFKNLFILTDEEVTINIALYDNNNNNYTYNDCICSLKDDDKKNILIYYLNMYPCNVVFFQEEKVFIVVYSEEARNSIIDKLKEINHLFNEEILNKYVEFILLTKEEIIQSQNNCNDVNLNHFLKKNFIEINKIKIPSIIVSDNNDFYTFLTCHNIKENNKYNIIASITNNLNIKRIDLNNKYNSKLTEYKSFSEYIFVSDITVLKDINETIKYISSLKQYKISNLLYEEINLIYKYEENMPIIPDNADMLGEVFYKREISECKIEVIGYGYCCHWLDSGDLSGLVYERLYLAKASNSTYKSMQSDLGAYCYKKENNNIKLHSFLVKILDEYIILIPAHFALEQIKKITKNKNLRFLKVVS